MNAQGITRRLGCLGNSRKGKKKVKINESEIK